MRRLLQIIFSLTGCLLLGGCLEVDQYPAWRSGEYDGKEDTLPSQAMFHGDRLAWNAAISNRTRQQNEYERTHP